MGIKLDSEEFKKELKKTEIFAKKIHQEMHFFPNPIEEENNRIYIGLTRNKMLHGERYCPCFMVVGQTKKEKELAENRVCPCEPALKKEIPNQGKCHCGIFCTEEYIKEDKATEKKKSAMKQKKYDYNIVLSKDEISGEELSFLLNARKKGVAQFILIDVRERAEYILNRISGVDYLIPTSEFYKKIDVLKDKKNTNIILQCHSGGRSYQAQQILKNLGYKTVINLTGGISSFEGKTEQG